MRKKFFTLEILKVNVSKNMLLAKKNLDSYVRSERTFGKSHMWNWSGNHKQLLTLILLGGDTHQTNKNRKLETKQEKRKIGTKNWTDPRRKSERWDNLQSLSWTSFCQAPSEESVKRGLYYLLRKNSVKYNMQRETERATLPDLHSNSLCSVIYILILCVLSASYNLK